MDLSTFNNDEEITQYLKEQLEKIHTLNECRLYKEEQLQLSDEILHFRNCIEWIIRANQVIINIRYALSRCLSFAEAMSWPLEETENKRQYSYYLEDSVYRDLVLWDMLRQLLNEFYECGHIESDKNTIFEFLKKNKFKIGDTKVNSIIDYLNSTDHKMVRETLRHSFTHSVDRTSSYVFHRNVNGKIQTQTDYIFPNHPFENLSFVIMDILKLIELFTEIANEMYAYRNSNFILLEVTTTMPCGNNINDSELWSVRIFLENYEQILVPCQTPCHRAIKYKQTYVCKPTKVNGKRIHSDHEKTSEH